MTQEERASLEFWNEKYVKRSVDSREEIMTDDWLQNFEKWIGTCEKVLDLGCGGGNDTRLFLEKGKTVSVCDQSAACIENIKRIFPEVTSAVCFHMPGIFPFDDETFDVVCADLSLHYFTEKDTFAILKEIKRILVPKGYLIVRVNSMKDVNHGAGVGEEAEHHLFKTDDGMFKRFFDKTDVEYFFASFDILFCEEQDMHRYSALKKVFTVCLQSKV